MGGYPPIWPHWMGGSPLKHGLPPHRLSGEHRRMISGIDHLVLTVEDIPRTCRFYQDVLDMRVIAFGDRRYALGFGRQKINLHQAGQAFEPKASRPTPGSADLCLLTTRPIVEVQARLKNRNIPIIEGPVERTGATGPILSVYFRDPDGNLIEVSEPTDAD